MSSLIDINYQETLLLIQQTIADARTKSMISVNQELLVAYRKIGALLVEKQKNQGWGSKIVDKLVSDIKETFPGITGFSKSNIGYMQRFSQIYTYDEICQAPLGKITRYHHITLFQKCNNKQERLRYAQNIIEHGRSRNILVHHIEHGTYQRSGVSVTNFTDTLPAPQSDFAQQIMKDPYIFDFLSLTENYKEKELEDQLVMHITHFLLELGAGFAFIGRQYNLTINDEVYRIDMLFYHIHLQCYVVVELKIGDFEPEFVGKVNFYINAIDKLLKKPHENKTLGIILCKNKNKVKAQYALEGVTTPISISSYDLEKIMGHTFVSTLPTIEELEETLQNL